MNTTNDLTKKLLLTVINKSDFACAIIYETGKIVFYNHPFEKIFRTDQDVKMPENLLCMLESDSTSRE